MANGSEGSQVYLMKWEKETIPILFVLMRRSVEGNFEIFMYDVCGAAG